MITYRVHGIPVDFHGEHSNLAKAYLEKHHFTPGGEERFFDHAKRTGTFHFQEEESGKRFTMVYDKEKGNYSVRDTGENYH